MISTGNNCTAGKSCILPPAPQLGNLAQKMGAVNRWPSFTKILLCMGLMTEKVTNYQELFLFASQHTPESVLLYPWLCNVFNVDAM